MLFAAGSIMSCATKKKSQRQNPGENRKENNLRASLRRHGGHFFLQFTFIADGGHQLFERFNNVAARLALNADGVNDNFECAAGNAVRHIHQCRF